jgi:putative toxin-antitoxin system antitoxin component (TIGR02293 family)
MGLPAVAAFFADGHASKLRTELNWLDAIEAGLPSSAVDRVVEKLGFSPAEIEQLVLSRRTLEHRRARKQALTADESVKLVRVARVALEAEDTFGDSGNARNWLRRPNRALNAVTPISLLDTDDGIRLVEDVLGRLAYGLFS